jgi:hypothetical protein
MIMVMITLYDNGMIILKLHGNDNPN